MRKYAIGQDALLTIQEQMNALMQWDWSVNTREGRSIVATCIEAALSIYELMIHVDGILIKYGYSEVERAARIAWRVDLNNLTVLLLQLQAELGRGERTCYVRVDRLSRKITTMLNSDGFEGDCQGIGFSLMYNIGRKKYTEMRMPGSTAPDASLGRRTNWTQGWSKEHRAAAGETEAHAHDSL